MAPKRGGSSKRPRDASHEEALIEPPPTSHFLTNEAELNFRFFRRRAIVPERGMHIEPPFTPYIAKASWTDFVQPPIHSGDRDMTYEFYANMAANPASTVYVRGFQVRITPRAINKFYNLPDYPMDDYRQLLQDGIDLEDFTRVMTGASHPLFPNWKFIPRATLTREAKVWYYFVAARLMPTMVNSEVRRERAILTYALLRGLSVDVGRVIHRDMTASVENRKCQTSFGFPALIYGLACAKGYKGPSLPGSVITNKQTLSLHLIDTSNRGRPAPQLQQHEDEDSEHEEEQEESPSLADRVTSLEHAVEDLRTQMTTGFASLREYIGEQFAARFPPPPPPS